MNKVAITIVLLVLCTVSFVHPFSSRLQHPQTRQRERPRTPLLKSSNYNPNDQETPEERQARMDLVRQIQANFYNTDDTDKNDDEKKEKWLQRDNAQDPFVLNRVPLWRVQWTEFPGYQNVLNVHVPHYTHMFRKLVLQTPQPWYFGHVFLYEGSKNLGNPDYFLPQTINGTLITKHPQWVPTIGTLMQVTDYTTLEDGRLSLIVQGVGRIQILEATQQVPYAVGNVKLLPDDELWQPAVKALTRNLDDIQDKDLIQTIGNASQAVACYQEESLRELEYRVTVMGKTNKEALEVSPLSNVNGSVSFDFPNLQANLNVFFRQRLSEIANGLGSDEILFSTSKMQLPPSNDENSDSQEVVNWEQNVWIELDRMIQLLETVQPGLKIPVPAQMLGLVPTNVHWPTTFRLERYADKLQGENVNVGTFSKPPFVRLSKQYPEYPVLRRASRFSYVVWMLLYTISFDNQSLDKEEVLQLLSIRVRLQEAHKQLQRLNTALLSMYEE